MDYHVDRATLNQLEELHQRLNALEANVFSDMLGKVRKWTSTTLTAHSISDYVHKKYSVEVAKDSESKLEFSLKDAKFTITKGTDANTFMLSKEGTAMSMPFKTYTELDTLIRSLTHQQGMGNACRPSIQDVSRYARAVMRSQALRGA
jgi:hypothetical protein